MAPLTKDTLEIPNPTGESVVSQSANQAKPASGHLRSDAISQEVPVRVHGSKVKDVVLGTTPHSEPFEEQTITMIIFPQGAVLKMVTSVNVGQMLVLTNLKSRQDAICRVIKVRPNANLASYVEVEFTNRQTGYWGVPLPNEGGEAASTVAPPPVNVEPRPAGSQKPVPDVSWAPAPPIVPAPRPLGANADLSETKPTSARPQTLTPPAKPEPSFISIGVQEEVQPAASETATIKPGSSRESLQGDFAPFATKGPAASEIPPTTPAAISISALRGDTEAEPSDSVAALEDTLTDEPGQPAASASLSSGETSRSTFGSFAGGATLAAVRATSSESFGAPVDSGEIAAGGHGVAAVPNWVLIAACVGLLIAGVGGGLFYLRGHSASKRPATGVPAAATPRSAPAEQPRVPTSISVAATADVVKAPPVNEPESPVAQVNPANGPSVTVNATESAKPLKKAPDAPPLPATAKKQATPKVTSDMMSQALNAHPTSAQREDAGAADAPALEEDAAPVPSEEGSMPGISSSNSMANLPPPTIQPDGPVKIGGNIKEPRLISSVLPVYPIGAIQAGVQGDVVIQTTIDKDGKVVEMHVVSGPTMLRQAALDALRRWKYEPSMLDGQPVAVQMLVMIKFRR
jgi:periplasmic protein TonB